jgi:hypothetical protein
MSIPKQQGREPTYEPGLRIAVAREYLTTNLGYKKLALKYTLPVTTVRGFVNWYREKYPDELNLSATKETKSPPSTFTEEDLKQAHLKITALEMLIEQASKELGVDLIKKFGTKQSKK